MRKTNMNAIPSGMAVAASAKLWMVSARSATLPEITTTTNCNNAVTSRMINDHLTAHKPLS